MGQWSAVVSWGRTATHAHLLPNGKVMWWGEYSDGDTPTLWDPATGTNAPLPRAGFNLFCSGHSIMADGRVFVAGGHIDNDTGLSTAASFDPGASAWNRFPDMNAGRWYPTVTTLATGDVLALSGEITLQVGNNPLPQVWEASSARWRDLTSATLSLPLYPWAFVAPAGTVFVAGPSAQSRFLTTAGTGTWTNGPSNHFPQERTYGSAVMYEPGKVLIAGGAPLDGVPTNSMEVIDLTAATPAWRVVGPLQRPRRQLNLTLLPDGTVLVTGGHSGTGRDNPNSPVLETELWNPATGTTTLLASSGAYRGYHSTAVLLPDGRVVSAGSTNVTTAQVFSPPYLFHGARPQLASAPSELAYGQAFDIGSPDAARIAQVTLVRLSSVTHSINMNQRFNRLTFTASAAGLTARTPDRPELAPPGHYLLFILDASGTPSVGRVVRLSGTALPASPDFSISADATSLTSSQGSSASTVLTIAPSGGFSGTVALSLAGNPTGSSASLNSSSVAVGPATGTSTLTLSPGSATAGTSTVTITATSGVLTHSLTLSYTIAGPAPAGIRFRSATTSSYPSGSTTRITVPIPPGTVAGDVLVASVGFGNSSATALPAITAPSGWTLVRRVDHGTVNSLAIYWHAYAAGDLVPTWTAGQSVGGAASISAYSGVAAAPMDVSAGKDAGSGSTFSTASVVTSAPDELLVASFFAHSAGGPTSWTPQAPLTSRTNFNNGGSRSMTTADVLQRTASTSGSFSAIASVSQDYGLTALVALRPAAAAASSPDFAVSADATQLNSSPGSSASTVVTITPTGGFSGTVALSLAGNPAGSSASFTSSSVAVGPTAGSSTLTLSPGTATAGTSTVTITATSGLLSHTVALAYTIAPAPAAGIAFRSAATASYPSGSTTRISVAIPPGTAAGDLLVASVGFGNSSATALPAITAPSGWALVRRVDHGTVNSLAIYWHVHAAGDLAPVWTTSQSVGGAASISTYAGAAASPLDAGATKDAGSGSTFSTAPVVTTAANELLVASFFAHSVGGVTSWSVQSPLSQRSTVNNGGSRSMTMADVLQPAAGASGSFTATASVLQDQGLSAVVALRPAGAPAPAADFSISANPASLSSSQGSAASAVLTIAPVGGFSGTVALSVAGTPDGSGASLSPSSVAAGPASGSSTLTILPGTATAGTSTVIVTATSGALSHSVTVSYTILPATGAGIAFRGATTSSYASGSTTRITAPIPPGTLPGDLLVASVGFGNTSATTLPALTAPPGWTQVSKVDHGTVNSLAIYWHVYATGDVAPVWTANQSVGGAASISAYSGAATSPIDVSAGRDAGAASSFTTPPSVTTGASELLIAAFFGHSSGGGATRWTLQAPVSARSNFNNGGSRSMTTGDMLQPAAGASAPMTATASVLQNYALSCVVALKPKPP
jgi:hypothetical protein